jgi:twitching motility protein PilT
MAHLDPLLAALVANAGDSLELADGTTPMLARGEHRHPLTKQPLSGAQIVALLREIAPPHVSDAMKGGGNDASFEYSNASGAFSARLQNAGGRWTASIRRASNGANGASPAAVVGVAAAYDEASAQEIESLLREMMEQHASDLHLRGGEPPILRVYGSMLRLERAALVPDQIEKMTHSIMPAMNREQFAERNDTDFAHEIDGLARFRCNVFRDRTGVGAVFRVIPAKVVTVEELGLSPEVQKLCYLTKGLVLVTGPTGSGKSTTLCALIDYVNRVRHDHIITIEDPIEFVHANKNCIITQRQVGAHTASFKSALRAALREDPDIVLVGELRDLETISIAIETAETGHLVFGTLHTTTAASTVDRVIDQFPADRQPQIRTMLSESLKGVISQTLCRKVGGGRVAAMEILLSTPAVSNLIREGKTFQIPSVMQTSRKLGMTLLNDVLLELVEQGAVEPREAYAKAVEKTTLAAALKAKGIEVSLTA